MAKNEIEYIWSGRKCGLFGLPWTFTRYFLTETKFITREGMLSLDEDELELYKVTDKKLVLPFWQRLFNCGTIILFVKDVDTPQKEIHCVKNPREVMKKIDKQIELQRDRWNTRGRDLMTITGGALSSGHHHHHCDDDDDNCDDD
ncbi:MAG: PH domain-containing protein [Oscillospiraceae bacterium]|nr:PH domain-containing protein [Oscillospiraceae bacterium]